MPDTTAAQGFGGLRRVVLIGFSATGKSAVAAVLAARLGWRRIDTDALIEQAAGRPIPAIFSTDGEHAFRAREREAVARAALEERAVVATGGGAWLDARNRALLADGGLVVALEARLDTILARHAAAESGRPDARPLLAGADPPAKAQRLKAARAPFYALADLTVHTDELPVAAVVEEILRLGARLAPRVAASAVRLHAMEEGPGVPSTVGPDFGPDVAATVDTGAARYPIYCGWGLLGALPGKLDLVGVGSRVFLVTDDHLRHSYGAQAVSVLRDHGREVHLTSVPPGEASKSLATLERLYAWLADLRAERSDTVLALGGGVVTDLAGTLAATYLRGIPLVHVPTSLLGMVDAAIGGKVAIDLPQGKNLVGAFQQPQAVIADVETLASLPGRELRAGYGEVIKHAFIRDPGMLEELEAQSDTLLALHDPRLDRPAVVRLIGRNMAIKAAVVSADEREAELRMILNYGHTIAHALEQVLQYGGLQHGEAVAVGLWGAARIAGAVGLLDEALVKRHLRVLRRFELDPSTLLARVETHIDVEAVLAAMRSDKKVAGGRQRWVLLESLGNPVIRDDIPEAVVREVVSGLLAS